MAKKKAAMADPSRCLTGTKTYELLVGESRDKKLYFVDRVRAGFAQHTRQTVYEALRPLVTKNCPFVNLPEKPGPHAVTAEVMKKCTWTRPEKKVEIEFVNRSAATCGIPSSAGKSGYPSGKGLAVQTRSDEESCIVR